MTVFVSHQTRVNAYNGKTHFAMGVRVGESLYIKIKMVTLCAPAGRGTIVACLYAFKLVPSTSMWLESMPLDSSLWVDMAVTICLLAMTMKVT